MLIFILTLISIDGLVSALFVTILNAAAPFVNLNSSLARLLFALGNPSLLSLVGSRMLFNMKEAGEHGVNEGTNCMVSTMSEIQFNAQARGEVTNTGATISNSEMNA